MSRCVVPPGRRSGPHPRRRQAAFTLIEMLVTMAVLAVILAFAAPSFVGLLQGQQVRGLAYDLTSDLLLARSEALKRNEDVSVVTSPSGPAGGWSVVTQGSGERLAARAASVQLVTVSDSPEVITFDPNGRVAFPTADVRITVVAGGSTRCIDLELSGRAQTLEGACP